MADSGRAPHSVAAAAAALAELTRFEAVEEPATVRPPCWLRLGRLRADDDAGHDSDRLNMLGLIIARHG